MKKQREISVDKLVCLNSFYFRPLKTRGWGLLYCKEQHYIVEDGYSSVLLLYKYCHVKLSKEKTDYVDAYFLY